MFADAALPTKRAALAWWWLRAFVLVAGIVLLALMAWDQTRTILGYQPLGIDFMPMWAAAHEAFIHPEKVYDFVGLTRFEHPLLANFVGLRPFVYPPPALLLFAPFGFLHFGLANAIWTAAGLALILATMAWQLKSQRFLLLVAMVLSPASVLVLITGQVTFVMATMAATGLVVLKQRPILAGVLFGLACAIKPQSLVMLPVALLAIRQWRTIFAAGATAALAVAASIAVLGVHAWVEWLGALQRFQDMVMNQAGFQKGMITPTALGITLRLDAAGLDVWRLGFAIGAVVMVWRVFRKTDDPARRLTALLGGSLFVTPYAMHYDAALLAPAAAMMLTHRRAPGQWVAALGAGALLCCAAIPYVGAAAVTAFVLVVSLTPETAFAPRRAVAPEIPAPAAG